MGALVVYDITKDVSFENVEKWLAELKENATAAAKSHHKTPAGLKTHQEAFRKDGIYVNWKFEELVKGKNNAFAALCRRVRREDLVVFTFGMDQ